MTSVVELFPKSRKLAYDARQQLSQVQNRILHVSELFIALDELNRQLSIMENLLSKETPSQRVMWQRKIQELQEDSRTIRGQGEYFDRTFSVNLRQQREREELLTRRRIKSTNENEMDQLAAESQSLQSSQNMMSGVLGSAEATFTNLVDQRKRLGGVNKLLLDIGNVVGLTSATMRVIERRDKTDAYFVFGGMVVTSIVIYICWFY